MDHFNSNKISTSTTQCSVLQLDLHFGNMIKASPLAPFERFCECFEMEGCASIYKGVGWTPHEFYWGSNTFLPDFDGFFFVFWVSKPCKLVAIINFMKMSFHQYQVCINWMYDGKVMTPRSCKLVNIFLFYLDASWCTSSETLPNSKLGDQDLFGNPMAPNFCLCFVRYIWLTWFQDPLSRFDRNQI